LTAVLTTAADTAPDPTIRGSSLIAAAFGHRGNGDLRRAETVLEQAVGSPAELGVTVDLGHCVVVEPDGVRGALLAAAPHLLNVQVDDMRHTAHEHLPFGDGELDLSLALGTLGEIGYTGVAAVELPRHSYDAPGLAHRSMTAMTEAWAAWTAPDPTSSTTTASAPQEALR